MGEFVTPVIKMVTHTRSSIHLSWTQESEDTNQIFYLLQMKDKIDGWLPKYWGLKSETIVHNLAPEEVYVFRVGAASTSNDKYVWSAEFRTATQIDSSRLYNLFRAVEKNNINELKEFLHERPRLVDALDTNGSTALVRAVRANCNQAVKTLLTFGADVNLRCEGSLRSGLMTACYHGNIEAARMLVAAGASIDLTDRIKCSALHYAVEGSQLEMIDFCFESGANVNLQDDTGWTPLMRARLSSEVIEKLLKIGIDLTLRDKYQRKIDDLATLTNNKQVLQHINDLDQGEVHGCSQQVSLASKSIKGSLEAESSVDCDHCSNGQKRIKNGKKNRKKSEK